MMLLWLLLAACVFAETHIFDFTATYTTSSPDGVFERRVIGINGEWPIPTIRVKKNDRVVINFTNGLHDRNSSLHFHGLFQRGQNAMDGPEMVTQCPVAPGSSIVYNFTVDNQVGTYWYHSHSGSQYGDGLRGLFIIDDTDPMPFAYDEELTLSVSEWYHKESPELMKKFLNIYNPTGAEPIPQNALFNETRNVTWSVKPDTTYFVRIANMGLFTSQLLYIEDHEFTIVEVDGVYVEPYKSQSLYITAAQRYGVLIKTKKNADKNYRFLNLIDKEMLDVLPEDLQLISTNWLQYSDKIELPEPIKNSVKKYDELVDSLTYADDIKFVPLAKEPLFDEPDYQIILDFTMDNLGNGVNYAFFNDVTYTTPKVPTLYTVMSAGKLANQAAIYGSNTNTFILQKDEVVEIVLNNQDTGKHPFHLHGHNFQIIYKSEKGEDDDNPITYDPKNPNLGDLPKYPAVRDTLQVRPNGFFVIRFKADNPGVWFFHCHVDWHLEQGLAITLVESPDDIQKQQIPENHFEVCFNASVPSKGNAAANFGSKEQWLDLTGERVQFAPLPAGFTPKGYFAMAACTVFALYGLFTIYKYGMEDIKSEGNEEVIRKLHKILDDHGMLNENEGISLNSDIQQ